MNEMAYFELFGRISDKYVTEALIPVVAPVPVPKKSFKQTPLGGLLTNPAFIAAVGVLAAAAVAVAVGFGLAGRGSTPDGNTETPAYESLWESDSDDRDGGETDGETNGETDGETDGETNRDTDTDGETESVADQDQDHPYIERKNYGLDVGIIYGKDLMGEGFTYLPEDMVFAGASSLNSDLYERIQKTADYLGVRIGLMEQEDDDAVDRAVRKMSGAGEYGRYFIIASGITMSQLGCYDQFLTPWETLDAINTEADYWDTALMQTYTQNGHSYIAYNSFIPPNAYAIAYNKSLYATAPNQRDLYGLVESGDWTVEVLMTVLNETAGINGRLAVHDFSSAAAYLSSVGFCVLDTVETETGYTQSSVMALRKETLQSQYLRALELVTMDTVLFGNYANEPTSFIENGEILLDTRLTRDLAGKTYGQPIGVLPLPKYDREQSEYQSIHVNAYMGLWCVEEDRQACGEVAELLAYLSRNACEDYNRAVMGVYKKDDSGVQKDLAMLRIIHHTAHDVGLTDPDLQEFFIPLLMDGEREISTGDEKQIKNLLRMFLKKTGW